MIPGRSIEVESHLRLSPGAPQLVVSQASGWRRALQRIGSGRAGVPLQLRTGGHDLWPTLGLRPAGYSQAGPVQFSASLARQRDPQLKSEQGMARPDGRQLPASGEAVE